MKYEILEDFSSSFGEKLKKEFLDYFGIPNYKIFLEEYEGEELEKFMVTVLGGNGWYDRV
jgi:hypothetical protein